MDGESFAKWAQMAGMFGGQTTGRATSNQPSWEEHVKNQKPHPSGYGAPHVAEEDFDWAFWYGDRAGVEEAVYEYVTDFDKEK